MPVPLVEIVWNVVGLQVCETVGYTHPHTHTSKWTEGKKRSFEAVSSAKGPIICGCYCLTTSSSVSVCELLMGVPVLPNGNDQSNDVCRITQ